VLSWSKSGNAAGPVVVYFHGTGNAKQDIPFPAIAEGLGIRVLMADRPGYGTSAPMPDASLLDIGRVVLGDLDDQNVEEFSVLGWSGGGPHALACAAVAPTRVRAVGLLSSWAPMAPPHRELPLRVRAAMRAAVALPRPAVRLMFLLERQTSVGQVDDVRRVARPWEFEVERVASAVRVLAFHAERDRQVPLAPWRDVKGIELTIVPGDAHDFPPDLWTLVLRRLTDVQIS
jgi:pimeloyl-ACP methyl ester carboxylesterase